MSFPPSVKSGLAQRLADYDRIIVASHNQGKVREIRDLLAPFGYDVKSAGELGLPDVEETADSYTGNAALKALAAANAAGLPALSDDSGLSVEALGGKPGIYSARWTENDDGERDWDLGMARVWNAIEQSASETRDAAFFCALCLAFPDGEHFTFLGRVDGDIVWPPRGDQGFGYDPIFQPKGFNITFGEMAPEKKHAMSHRADAFAQLLAAGFDRSKSG